MLLDDPALEHHDGPRPVEGLDPRRGENGDAQDLRGQGAPARRASASETAHGYRMGDRPPAGIPAPQPRRSAPQRGALTAPSSM